MFKQKKFAADDMFSEGLQIMFQWNKNFVMRRYLMTFAEKFSLSTLTPYVFVGLTKYIAKPIQ